MKNLTLAAKLLAGFILVALIVVVVAGVGVIGARRIASNVRAIGSNLLPASTSILTIKASMKTVESAQNLLAVQGISDADRQNSLAQFDAADKAVQDAIKTFEKTPRTKAELTTWNAFRASYDSWWSTHQSFLMQESQYHDRLQAVQEEAGGKPTDKPDALAGQMLRSMLSFFVQQRVVFDEAYASLTKEDDFLHKLAADAVTGGEQIAQQVGLTAVIALVAGPGLALVLGFFLSLSISRPLRRGVALAEQVSEGDFTQRLEISQKDEIGKLAQALNAMSGKLRDMVMTLRESAQQVALSSREIAGSAQELAGGAQSQASTLEETAASVEELSASVDQVSEHARSQAVAVQQGAASMLRVQKSIEEVSTNLAAISELAIASVGNAVDGAQAVRNVVEGIGHIAQSSEKIGGIVGVISDIADQTNLLALNASIEAARAGEHGRGFAVVAEEVGKLADRSSSSAKEIEGLIKESVKRVSEGVDTAMGSQNAMDHIRTASQKVSEMIGDLSASVNRQVEAVMELSQALSSVREMSLSISTATEEQTANARQVSKAVESVTEVTQSAASSAEQMSAATERLSEMAQALQEMTTQFRVESSERAPELPASAPEAQ